MGESNSPARRVLRDEGTERKNQARADQMASVTVTPLSQLQGAAKSQVPNLRGGEQNVLGDNWVNVIRSLIYLSNQAALKQLLELKNGTTVKNLSWFSIIFPFVSHQQQDLSVHPILYLNSPLSKTL